MTTLSDDASLLPIAVKSPSDVSMLSWTLGADDYQQHLNDHDSIGKRTAGENLTLEASQSVQKWLDCLQSSVGETAGKPVSCLSVHCSNAILAVLDTKEAAEAEGAGKELQTESLSEQIAAQAVLRNLPSMSGYQRDQLFHLITANDFLWLVRTAAITLAHLHAKEALGEH